MNNYKDNYIFVLKEIERLKEEEQKLDASNDEDFEAGTNHGKIVAYTDILLLMYKKFLMSEENEYMYNKFLMSDEVEQNGKLRWH